MSKTFVIAEAGVNHNGSLDLAKKLVDVAREAGADAVKFQTFRAARLVAKHARKAAYQEATTGGHEGQEAMIRRLELPDEWHYVLRDHANRIGIRFLSTPFDELSVDFLAKLGVDRLKVSSGDLTNGPLLQHMARTGLPVILSTGMGSLAEIELALAWLASGYTGLAPNLALIGDEGHRALREKVTLLHCTTEYPAPASQVNLRAMLTMRDAFGLAVGYSDHTEGLSVSVAAVAMGASLIEKHFTLDKSMEGPDHRASLEPAELSALVREVRLVEEALGHGRKVPCAAEIPNMPIARKSLVARRAIKKGELFSEENTIAKRPGNGISPMRRDEVFGRQASRDFDEDDLIEV